MTEKLGNQPGVLKKVDLFIVELAYKLEVVAPKNVQCFFRHPLGQLVFVLNKCLVFDFRKPFETMRCIQQSFS